MDGRDAKHTKFFAWVDSADRESLLTQYYDLYSAETGTNPYVNHRAMSDEDIRQMLKQFVLDKSEKETSLKSLREVIKEVLKRYL